ncbi:hypothetical protein RJ55_04387 [Drechmeria coniospora]|nr:hypothetical protein RJ55_04387 [Drechmeria coniospora]
MPSSRSSPVGFVLARVLRGREDVPRSHGISSRPTCSPALSAPRALLCRRWHSIVALLGTRARGCLRLSAAHLRPAEAGSRGAPRHVLGTGQPSNGGKGTTTSEPHSSSVLSARRFSLARLARRRPQPSSRRFVADAAGQRLDGPGCMVDAGPAGSASPELSVLVHAPSRSAYMCMRMRTSIGRPPSLQPLVLSSTCACGYPYPFERGTLD